jgi:mitogen-activated protein kinase 7
VTDDYEQKFDFGFEEEDTIEGMKKLIVEEVNSFRAEVRAQARAAGQVRRQDRFVLSRRKCVRAFSHNLL